MIYTVLKTQAKHGVLPPGRTVWHQQRPNLLCFCKHFDWLSVGALPPSSQLFVTLKLNISNINYNQNKIEMEIQADLEESEIFSLSRRPFQETNETGKIVCSKCFEVEKVFNFFDKEKGLKQHFRIIHHDIELSNLILAECKTLFQRQHGEETIKVIQQLTNLRLLTVSKLIKLFYVSRDFYHPIQ